MDVHQEIHRIDDIPSLATETDDMLPIEMTNATGTHLLDLNEYGLIEIFSSNSLTPIDLCSLAETCKLFKQITQRSFPNMFAILSYAHGYGYAWKGCLKFDRSVDERDVDRILKHFGTHLSTLSIKGSQADVNLITKYCGDVKLKRLDLSGLQNIQDVRVQLKLIIKRLLILLVINCDLKDYKSPDMNCDSLIELTIYESTGCDKILDNTFPNLERFSFSYGDILSTSNPDITGAMSKFLGRHTRLTTLNLMGYSICCSSELVDVIGNSCQQLKVLCLKRLKISDGPFDVLNPLSLPKLRRLEVSLGYNNERITLLQASSSLETIHLCCGNKVPDQVFDVLSQLQNLRQLQLAFYTFPGIPSIMLMQLRRLQLFERAGRFCATDLLNIIQQMPNLGVLLYWGNDVFALDENNFTKIVKIVEPRSQVLVLECRCNFNDSNEYDAKRKVILRRI